MGLSFYLILVKLDCSYGNIWTERAWEGALKGVRSRVCINIGKPFGPYKISGNKKKEDKLNKIGHEMMCRIAHCFQRTEGAFQK